ncbi:hypothetical protein MesoLjLc_04310 [Mesorhizobium sp. L-8-10]|uniref:phosphotransferase family protein n=1 Tax=unclassified Mesorhizobium TaxID=325217 RepID=UPI0019287E9E|nr:MULTISPECIES: aminoglycoside phosphotransferase family protein [unclassified Mesorhizobium]BCH20656.1 hypothetical protein MesoLjLb_04410 [Mesorhizobium sp. L-8-3]BCH28501.1 hypothetical protein MesoLjLc_04310 [Mesorhizobium sp. L-8-10]
MTREIDLPELRTTILRDFPELAKAEFKPLTAGWHSVAVDVGDRLIFKFPRHETAQRALIKEASLLALVRPAVTMSVPDLTLHEGPPMYSRHRKLRGDHLVAAQYDRLPEPARDALGRRLGEFYAQLHRLDHDAVRAAGAGPVEAWLSAEEILARAVPALPVELRGFAEETVAEWRDMPPDPYGTTYGFFDGHGWNMAFDHGGGTLCGIYDFADSGFGPLHQEFIYSNFISPDLTRRIADNYEALSGRQLDHRRIDVLTGMHRLSELAAFADDPARRPDMIRHVADWARP